MQRLGVLGEPQERVQERLEVGLADQGGAVAGVVEHLGDRRRVDRAAATPFIHTPWVAGYWPVSMVARDGMHTTDWGWARS